MGAKSETAASECSFLKFRGGVSAEVSVSVNQECGNYEVTIGGEKFDRVIVATEPVQIPYLFKFEEGNSAKALQCEMKKEIVLDADALQCEDCENSVSTEVPSEDADEVDQQFEVQGAKFSVLKEKKNLSDNFSVLKEKIGRVFTSFDRVGSGGYIHTEEFFMPRNFSWECFNVHQIYRNEKTQHKKLKVLLGNPDMSQLTIWLNKFFDKEAVNFDNTKNYFISWNPTIVASAGAEINTENIATADAENTLTPGNLYKQGKFLHGVPNFWRIVQKNENQRELWKEIDSLQGACDNKIFICGAYSIPGMGLLEQGVRSADKVVEHMFRG